MQRFVETKLFFQFGDKFRIDALGAAILSGNFGAGGGGGLQPLCGGGAGLYGSTGTDAGHLVNDPFDRSSGGELDYKEID